MYTEFNGGNLESYIRYLTTCNTLSTDKNSIKVIAGCSKNTEQTVDELEYLEIETPSGSSSLITKLSQKRKPNEDAVSHQVSLAKEKHDC